MKKYLVLFILLFSLANCTKEDDKIDDSHLYDQDANCTFGVNTCCDIDGRILVERNSTYKYSSTTSYAVSNIEWEILSGDITIVSGQNTNTLTIRFGENFTIGKIRSSTTSTRGDQCNNTFEINKL